MATNRNRTIYQVLALYASQVKPSGQQTGVNAIQQLSRVQSFDEDFTRNFTDVNQFGNLAAIDRIETEAPTVNASLSYYLTNGLNEYLLGLTVQDSGSTESISCISGLLNKNTDEKNYYLLIADEGNDAVGYQGTTGVIGIGNGFITSYSATAAIGDIPTASVDMEALNIRVYSDVTGATEGPGVNPADGTILPAKFILPTASSITGDGIPNALQPGDISLNIPANAVMGFNETDLKVQDFTLSFDLARTPLQKLGNRFAFSREIDFPVTATLEINAEVGSIESGNLADVICNNDNYDFTIQMAEPGCGTNKPLAMAYTVKGAKLASQNFSSSIGENATMTATYEVQIGGPQDNDRGIFISGSFGSDEYAYTASSAFEPVVTELPTKKYKFSQD
jgi:hypothetical protein